MNDNEESSGEVSIEKPGKIRWEVKSEGKLQILNGKKLIHVHIPKRRKGNVVDIYQNISKELDTQSLSFLSGTDEFKSNYVLNIIKNSEKVVEVKLIPKNATASSTYIAEFDKASYLLRSLSTESADSTVRTEFSDIRINVFFDPEVFDYKPGPKDVVTVTK